MNNIKNNDNNTNYDSSKNVNRNNNDKLTLPPPPFAIRERPPFYILFYCHKVYTL